MTAETPIKLENWAVVGSSLQAPEQRETRLDGVVYGHPKKADGKAVTTSPVVSVNKRIITTRSGSVYQLGKIDPKYRKFLRDNSMAYDPKDPIKLVDKLNPIIGPRQ